MSGFVVDPERLETHGRRVGVLADAVGEASAAVRSTHIGGGAFGVMCSFLVPPVSVVTDAVASMVSAAEGTLNGSSTQVVEMAAEFSRADDETAQDFYRSAGALDGMQPR